MDFTKNIFFLSACLFIFLINIACYKYQLAGTDMVDRPITYDSPEWKTPFTGSIIGLFPTNSKGNCQYGYRSAKTEVNFVTWFSAIITLGIYHVISVEYVCLTKEDIDTIYLKMHPKK